VSPLPVCSAILSLLLPGTPPSPAPDRPALEARAAELYVPVREFPRMPFSRFALDVGSTLARPFRPQLTDAFVLVPAAALVALATRTDIETYAAIRRLPDPMVLGRSVSAWVSTLGEGWFDLSVFLLAGLVGGDSGQRVCIAGVQALIAVAIASRLGKVIFREERPSFDARHHHLFGRLKADSMPSGHSMTAFATAAVLSEEWPYLAPVFYVLAGWLGVARVQQSTHWVSDVLVGAALGTLFGWESYRVTKAFELQVSPWVGPGGGGLGFTRRF
jgi:membrane-associated phospholipid phosphatase